VAVVLFTFLTCWNELLFALMFTHTPALPIVAASFAPSVLPAGSDHYLGMRIEGEEMLFRVGKHIRYAEGETIRLAVDTGRLHIFDATTGRNPVWSTP
jgi:hypothetical protein